MDIGIPKELRDLDHRVQLGTNTVAQLTAHGHKVFVQTGAGDGAGFGDESYLRAGATIVYSAEEVHKRAQLICRVNTPTAEDVAELQAGQIVSCFAHLSAASPQRMERILRRGVSVVAWELLRDERGDRAVLRPMSEIAGRLVPQIGARLLESPAGRGLLLAGIPGVPAAEVTILGAGEVGFNAARAFAGLGAQVTVLDQPARLSAVDQIFDTPGRFRLMYAFPDQIAKAAAWSDVLVCAILIPGERAPHLVAEQTVASMRPGSVIIDVSIDQGGCVETSRPTTLRDPTFVKHGVIHYCVPNFTALVARTASRTLSSVVRPYIIRLADDPDSLLRDPELRSALVVHRGRVVSAQLAAAHGIEHVRPEDVA
jgi:alanine dehydrogenase